jgi:hypothetical protein
MFAKYTQTPQSSSIITLGDGHPFLLEQRLFKGTALLFAVSANNDWSDFPTKGLFAPILHRSVSYLGQRGAQPQVIQAGDASTISMGKHSGARITVRRPDKVDILVETVRTSVGNGFRFKETTLPGIYTIKSEQETIGKFVVTMNPDESNTVRAERKTIESMLLRLGIVPETAKTITRGADADRTILESRLGVELWKYFMAAALMVALFELALSRSTQADIRNQQTQ